MLGSDSLLGLGIYPHEMLINAPGMFVVGTDLPVELVIPLLISPIALICATVEALDKIKASTFCDELMDKST
jgi:hypothetical protein